MFDPIITVEKCYKSFKKVINHFTQGYHQEFISFGIVIKTPSIEETLSFENIEYKVTCIKNNCWTGFGCKILPIL